MIVRRNIRTLTTIDLIDVNNINTLAERLREEVEEKGLISSNGVQKRDRNDG